MKTMVFQLVGVLLICFGAWIASLNWYVFWNGLVLKKLTSSWVPILGGGCLAFGFWLAANSSVQQFWWIAFFCRLGMYSWHCARSYLASVKRTPTDGSNAAQLINTELSHDGLGRKSSMTDPDKGTLSYTYNALRERLTQTDRCQRRNPILVL